MGMYLKHTGPRELAPEEIEEYHAIILSRVEYYARIGGKAGIQEFKELVDNPNGRLIGFIQSKVNSELDMDQYPYKGGRLCNEEVSELLATLDGIHKYTNLPHGDLTSFVSETGYLKPVIYVNTRKSAIK